MKGQMIKDEGAIERAKARTKVDFTKVRGTELEKFIVDRSTHPGFYVSSWPVNYGHKTLNGKERYRLPTLNHNSVLVTVISNDYGPDVWWRLQNMLRYTEEKGYLVALEEVDDLSIMPTDAIGIMRACAGTLAVDSGFDWCFMVDTDVLLEEDTLVKLIERDRPVLFPFLDILHDKFQGGPVSAPMLYPYRGLQPVAWAAMSAMLFNTRVFNCLDAYAWHGHDYHFAQQLNHYGHRIYVDTDTVIKVLRGPTRNPSKPWSELMSSLEHGYDKRQNQDRDRRPPPDWNPAFDKGVVDQDGVYWAVDKWRYGGVFGPVSSKMVQDWQFLKRQEHEEGKDYDGSI